MNVRKPINYSAMYAVLDALMASDLPQMKLYCEIGQLVSGRPEKGAAVAASEYLRNQYPDRLGFSPRNLRRMREFYRTYDAYPQSLSKAMTIGWTQNVVILEAKLTMQEKAWYIQAVQQLGWSKQELQRNISASAHLKITLDTIDEACYTEEKIVTMECRNNGKATSILLQTGQAWDRPRQKKGLPDEGQQLRWKDALAYGIHGPPQHKIASLPVSKICSRNPSSNVVY